MNDRPTTALVLSGGGARGAYQVGVLRGLLDLGRADVVAERERIESFFCDAAPGGHPSDSGKRGGPRVVSLQDAGVF